MVPMVLSPSASPAHTSGSAGGTVSQFG